MYKRYLKRLGCLDFIPFKGKSPSLSQNENKHYFEQFICMYNHSSLVKYTASVIERSFQACHTCTIWYILQVQIFSGCCFSPQLCLHMQASCYWCLYFGPDTKGCESVKPIWSGQISPISMWNWGCRWMSPKFGDIHLQP